MTSIQLSHTAQTLKKTEREVLDFAAELVYGGSLFQVFFFAGVYFVADEKHCHRVYTHFGLASDFADGML